MSLLARCARSPKPVSVTAKTSRPNERRRAATSRHAQPPRHAPGTRTSGRAVIRFPQAGRAAHGTRKNTRRRSAGRATRTAQRTPQARHPTLHPEQQISTRPRLQPWGDHERREDAAGRSRVRARRGAARRSGRRLTGGRPLTPMGRAGVCASRGARRAPEPGPRRVRGLRPDLAPWLPGGVHAPAIPTHRREARTAVPCPRARDASSGPRAEDV
jgi:hypothetical protein